MRISSRAALRWLLMAMSFLGFWAPSAGAQAAIGVFGGLDRTDLSGDAPSKAKYRSQAGFAIGVVGELRIADDVWLTPQPAWIQRGTRIAFAVQGEDDPVDSLKVTANYLTLPVLVKIVSGHGKTYVSGGLDLGLMLDATISGAGEDQDVSDGFDPVDLSANFAFGVMLPVGRPRLTFELRYSQSILNVAGPEQAPELYSLPPRFRWTGLRLFAGFLYPLGGGER